VLADALRAQVWVRSPEGARETNLAQLMYASKFVGDAVWQRVRTGDALVDFPHFQAATVSKPPMPCVVVAAPLAVCESEGWAHFDSTTRQREVKLTAFNVDSRTLRRVWAELRPPSLRVRTQTTFYQGHPGAAHSKEVPKVQFVIIWALGWAPPSTEQWTEGKIRYRTAWSAGVGLAGAMQGGVLGRFPGAAWDPLPKPSSRNSRPCRQCRSWLLAPR